MLIKHFCFFDSFYFSMETAYTDHSSRTQQKGPPPPSPSYESKCVICHLHSAGLMKYTDAALHVMSLLNHLLHP